MYGIYADFGNFKGLHFEDAFHQFGAGITV
jgi:hypothetical protein